MTIVDRTPVTAREYLVLVGGPAHDFCTVVSKSLRPTAIEIHCSCGTRILCTEDDLIVEFRTSIPSVRAALRNVPEEHAS